MKTFSDYYVINARIGLLELTYVEQTQKTHCLVWETRWEETVKNSVGWRYNIRETANTILQSAQWCHTIWMWLDFIIKQNLKNKPIVSVLFNAFKTNRPNILCPSMSYFLLKNYNPVPFGTLLPLPFLKRDEIRRLRFVCFCNVPIIE